MKRIEDKEVKAKFDDVFKARWSDKPMSTEDIAEHFFAAGYEAAIAERAEFDEQRIDNWARMVLKDRQKRNKRK